MVTCILYLQEDLCIIYLYNKLKCCPAYTALSCFYSTLHTEAEHLDDIQTKFLRVLRVFLLAVTSIASKFPFLQIHAISNSFYS
jgi:hypothetical protein